MPYANSTTVLQLVPGINVGQSSTADALNAHIRRADDIINGMLGRRYAVPFTTTTVPPMVRTIAEDLASGMLFRSLYTRDSQNKNEWTEVLIDQAFKMLEKIAEYEVDLRDTAGSLIGETDSGSRVDSSTENFAPIFDLDSITSQEVSAARLDTITASKR